MRHEGERRALGAVAMATLLLAFACSSRHRLGRLESDESTCEGGSRSVGNGGQASGAATGGVGAASHAPGQAGEDTGGDAATPRLPPDVFVAH